MAQPARIAVRGTFASLLALASVTCGGSDLTLPVEIPPTIDIAIFKGNNQSGAPGTMLKDSIVVQVTDSTGAPVAGQQVEFIPDVPEAAVTPRTATTDEEGIAGARWVLGPAVGPQEVVAHLIGDVSAQREVRFIASAVAGAPSAPGLAVLTQPSSSAKLGEKLARQPVVQIRDAAGNDLEIEDVAVTAAIASGGGTLGGTTTRRTDANGRVEFTDLRIEGSAGSTVLIFAAPGYTSVVSDAIEVSPSGSQKAATTTRITSDTPDPSASGQSVLVQFTVTSDAGTPTGNVVITATGGSATCTASVTAGSCSLILTNTGQRELIATYAGNGSFAGSSDRENHLVQSAAANQPPTAGNDEYNTIEGANHTLTVGAGAGVLQNDRDPEGGPLTASDASDPPHGRVTLHGDGSFSYTPVADFFGDDQFTYRVRDGSGNSSTATVTLHVAPVNDRPAFTLGTRQVTVSHDAGPQSVNEFVASLSPGAANETDQRVEFQVVGNSDPGLFSDPPLITRDSPQSRTATLTFTPAAGRTGSASVTIILRDDGGTANGGNDTSQPQTFTITVR
jgi:Big-like domain-containing protein